MENYVTLAEHNTESLNDLRPLAKTENYEKCCMHTMQIGVFVTWLYQIIKRAINVMRVEICRKDLIN